MRKAAILIVLVFFIVAVGAVWLAGSSLTAPVPAAVGACPSDLRCETVEISSDSGSRLKAWFFAGDEGRGAVVIMHGLRSNRLALVERVRFLRKAGFSVLTFDFQGSGESPGSALTFGHLESRDATAALSFMKQRLPNEKVGVLGISMGGAAYLLQKDVANADSLILEMVYPEFRKAVDNRLNLWLFSGADAITPIFVSQLPVRLGFSADELRPITGLETFRGSLLVIAGENDVHTTLAESRQLFEAGNQPKDLWIVPNAKHEDLHKVAPTDYETKVLSFFEKSLRK